MEEEWDKFRQQLTTQLDELTDGKFTKNDVPLFPFGEENYDESLKSLFFKLHFDTKYSEKYIYTAKATPVETKSAELLNLYQRYQILDKEINDLKKEIG